MVIAMMLPTTLPLLTMVLRRGVGWYAALLLVGYCISWLCFGGLIYGRPWTFQHLPGMLMFTNSASSFGAMLGLGALMLAETVSPWGRRLVLPIGLALLVWGAVLMLGAPATPVHLHHH